MHISKKFSAGQGLLLLVLLAATANSMAQLTPSADAYINTGSPATNYGAAATLNVVSPSQAAFIAFDLSAIPSGYTGSSIAKATLKLYVSSVTTAGSFNVDFVNGSWSESTLTANSAPALGTTIAASVPLTKPQTHDYVLIDITPALQAWLNGTEPNDGIALVANSPLSAMFESKENTKESQRAELDVVFTGGGTITGINTASGSGLTGGGTSGTLKMSLTTTCATNQVLQWNGTAWVCANVGTGTITGVTAGTDLTGGGTGGNVTLNLNTAALQTANDARYAQLNAVNAFTQPFSLSTSASTGIAASAVSIGLQGSSAGTGVYGTTSGSGIGVFGTSNNATGVRGNDGGSGNGVIGGSQTGIGVGGISISGTGVYGSTSAANGSSNGVQGASTNATAVRGDDGGSGSGVVGTSSTGFGVYGTSASGYGFATNSNVQQARTANGWVKAMAVVTPYSGGITLTNCFNSTLAGSAATTSPCGITLVAHATGITQLDFGFQIDDRFFAVTAHDAPLTVNTVTDVDDITIPSNQQVKVFTYNVGANAYNDVSFTILIY